MVAGPPSICGVGSISCLEFTRAALTNLRVCDAGMYVYPRSGVCLSARARCTYPWRRRRPPASPGVACMQGSAGGHPFLPIPVRRKPFLSTACLTPTTCCRQECIPVGRDAFLPIHCCPQECIPVHSMFDTHAYVSILRVRCAVEKTHART